MINMSEQIQTQDDNNEKPLLDPDMATHLSLARLTGALRKSMEGINDISSKKTEDENSEADSAKSE